MHHLIFDGSTQQSSVDEVDSGQVLDSRRHIDELRVCKCRDGFVGNQQIVLDAPDGKRLAQFVAIAVLSGNPENTDSFCAEGHEVDRDSSPAARADRS